jgi:cytoskeletal protein RodZ
VTDVSQPDAQGSLSVGAKLKSAREKQGMSTRDAADRLNWMPDYVAVIESDNYEKLRNPAFARGYVKAYSRLVGLDENAQLAAFDRIREERASNKEAHKKRTRPLHLHKTGRGVFIGLGALLLLVLFLWWRSS